MDSSELQIINKSTWAKVLARLNHLARNRTDYTPHQVISEWFSADNNAYANSTYQKLIAGYGQLGFKPEHLTLISLWSNLSVYDRVLNATVDGQEVLDGNRSEVNLFEYYLGMNEEFAKGSNRIAAEMNPKDFKEPIDYLVRVDLAGSITYNDFTHYKPIELLVSQFVKAFYCFRFLQEQGHQQLVNIFLQRYGAETWQEYLRYLLPIMNSAVIRNDDSGLYYLNVEDKPGQAKAKAFLEQLTLTSDQPYSIQPDFLNARANPLFKTEDNSYLIMDPVLTVNRLYNSIFFEMLRIAENNQKLHPAYNSFFTLYTYDFIEQYLAYTLLNKIFSRSQCYKLSGKEIKDKFKIEEEPDFYVRKGNKVFLFEVKGSVVTGKTKQSFSYAAIEKELKAKFCYDEKDKQNKAIVQLVNRICLLLKSKEIPYDKTAKVAALRVYPILLASELSLTTPGVNFLMNQWFWQEVEKHDMLNQSRHRIHDLLILDFDTLVLYSQAFEETPKLFEQTILNYYKSIAKRKIRPSKGIPYNEQFITLQMRRSFIPYSDFLRDEVKMKTPAIFMDFGAELLEDQDKRLKGKNPQLA